MKGLILNLPIRRRGVARSHKRYGPDLWGFLRRYGIITFYVVSFALGVLLGSLKADRAGEQMLSSLDFLFTTNLSARLTAPMYMTFASSFASNFLFLFSVYLLGLTAWGACGIFIIVLFKGFGTGLCAGFLIINHGLKGLGFYLLIMLLGLFLFCFALILEATQAHSMSLKIAGLLFFSKESVEPLKVFLRGYSIRSLYMLILATVASVADMLLWTLFAKVFFN